MFENIDYRGLTGIIVTPDDRDYDKARQVYNRAIQKYPLAIVYCLKIWDVANAVKWARCRGVGFRIRGGGHNYEGYCVGNGVLVVDISRLNAVSINRCNDTVTVQGGALNRDLYAALAPTGRAFPGGSCPAVGVAGYAMGGGWNYFCRCLGLGCDSPVGLRMVNYEGDILTANECENPDLYWACRGGGDNNFGVAVELTFRIPRTRGCVTYFEICRPDADAKTQARFLAAWQKWLPCLDCRMTLRPSLYHSASEGRAIYSRGIFFGRPEEARALLKPLIRSADMTFKAKYVTFPRAVQILGSVYPPDEMFMMTGRFVQRDYSPREIESVVSLLDERPCGVELVELGLFAMGGRVRCARPRDTAFFYRNASYIIAMQAVWTDPAFAENGADWVAEAFEVIEPLTVGSFVNFPYDCLLDYEKAYYGGNVPRLRQVKRQYDPENVFNFPQSIRLI